MGRSLVAEHVARTRGRSGEFWSGRRLHHGENLRLTLGPAGQRGVMDYRYEVREGDAILATGLLTVGP